MQVLLRKSDVKSDIVCSICGQNFRIYWERTSMQERDTMRKAVTDELMLQHVTDRSAEAHPAAPFNVPKWTGLPQFSGAAMLGGLSGFHRVAKG